MKYYVIYDGQCNLCVNGVRILESLDQAHIPHPKLFQREITEIKNQS